MPPGRPKEGPKEPAWKKEVREAREKKQHTEPEKVCDGKKDVFIDTTLLQILITLTRDIQCK